MTIPNPSRVGESEPVFRFVDHIPTVGTKAYPWAFKCNENPPDFTFGYDAFTLLLENGWTVECVWATRPQVGWPEFDPPARVAAASAQARYLVESLTWHPGQDGPWPFEPFSDWYIERRYITAAEELDALIAEAMCQPSPPFGEPDGARRERERRAVAS